MIKIFHSYHNLFFCVILEIGDIVEFLDGKKLQKQVCESIKKEINLLGIKPFLAVISIGNTTVNNVFYHQIERMCQDVGYKIVLYPYEAISLESLKKLINKLNQDVFVTAIMLVRPIPSYLSFDEIRNLILPNKDIEGMHDLNRLKMQNREGGYIPGTVLGIIMLLNGYHINIAKKNVVIINRTEQIGKPLMLFFLDHDCTVTLCHSKTENLLLYVKEADIVISATGIPHLLDHNMFKTGSIVIDVGLSYKDGKMVGDVDFSEGVSSPIRYAVRSIGGTGPMTVAGLANNILKSYYLNFQDIDGDEF